jgi:hypothetical protein
MNEVFLRIAWQWFCPTYAGNSKSINIIWKCEQYSLAAGLGPGRCSFSCKPKLRPGLKLHEINVDDTSHFHFPRSGSFEFLFVTDPTNWETIPYAACRLPRHGIVMKQSAPAMPLMQHTLRDQSSSMTVEDIGRCVKRLKIETSSDDLPSMLSALATKICDGDEEAARKEANLFHKAREPNRNTDDMLLDDPLVDLVYEEMDDKDKGEFKEIGDAKDKRKLSATLRKWNAACATAAKKKQHRRVGRAKGRGKGEVKVKGKGRGKGKVKVKGKGKGKGNGKAVTVPSAPLPLPTPIPPAPIPLPAPTPSAPEAALVVAAVPTQADPRPRGRASASYNNVGPDELIYCDNCAGIIGKKWKSEMPGNRDQETWYFTVWNRRTNGWYKKSPGLKSKQSHKFVDKDTGERKTDDERDQEINDWLQDNKGCCNGALA